MTAVFTTETEQKIADINAALAERTALLRALESEFERSGKLRRVRLATYFDGARSDLKAQIRDLESQKNALALDYLR